LTTARFTSRPLTPDSFASLEELFGRPGGSIVRGCWCMHFRRSGRTDAGPDDNRAALRGLAGSDVSPGLVGYLGERPVGWISLGPREDYLRLRRSPIMRPVDDTEVWSIVCSFVDKAHRGRGLQRRLLDAAVDHARDQGVRTLEAYPVDKLERSHDDFMFFGSRGLYERAGFKEVARRSPTRVVMRRTLRPRATR
jgi:ribosomal protein S18 acetylase RimI-like enzyme